MYQNPTISLQIVDGAFVVAKRQINEIPKNAVGLVCSDSNDLATVFFIGQKVKIETNKSHICPIDIEETGKGYLVKICNICHIMKATKEFDKNQTDAKGRATTRPSCRECRRGIDGVKLTASENRRMMKTAPKNKTLFTCPICQKMSVVGITANLVKDHDHNTGMGREWLCDSCNTGLGRFKDDIEIFNRIIDYLRQFSS